MAPRHIIKMGGKKCLTSLQMGAETQKILMLLPTQKNYLQKKLNIFPLLSICLYTVFYHICQQNAIHKYKLNYSPKPFLRQAHSLTLRIS